MLEYLRAETLNPREPCTEAQGLKLPSTQVDFGLKQSSPEDFSFQPGQLIARLTCRQQALAAARQ